MRMQIGFGIDQDTHLLWVSCEEPQMCLYFLLAFLFKLFSFKKSYRRTLLICQIATPNSPHSIAKGRTVHSIIGPGIHISTELDESFEDFWALHRASTEHAKKANRQTWHLKLTESIRTVNSETRESVLARLCCCHEERLTVIVAECTLEAACDMEMIRRIKVEFNENKIQNT